MSVAWNTDVDLHVDAAFGYAPYDTSPVWTDIAQYVHNISVTRGETATPYPSAAAGTGTILLDNDDGRFDPSNSLSAYDPDVVLTVPIRIQATYNAVTYPVFYGFVTKWGVGYPDGGKRSVVELAFTDGMQFLNQQTVWDAALLGGGSGPRADARIADILTLANWPPSWTDLDVGLADMGPLSDAQDQTVFEYMAQVASSDAGAVFIAADGTVKYHSRLHHSGGATSEGTFGPSDLRYIDVTPEYDDQFLYNEVVISGTFGGTVEIDVQADDATSITANTTRSLPLAGVQSSQAEASNVAEWNVEKYKTLGTRITALVVLPQRDPAALWPIVLGLDLQDSIIVKTEPPGSGDDLNQQVSIQAISWSITLDTWNVEYGCFPLATIETNDFWILGTSKLDTETRLA